MSIATLKRKTAYTVKASLANGQTSFSLNGTHRSQGFVGQTSLSRSLPKTMMRGNAIRGYGGCCGAYDVTPIVQSAVTSTEDSRVVKPSVKNTEGMLHTKYAWLNSPSQTSVKPDTTQNTNTQQQYIDNLHRCTVNAVDASNSAVATTRRASTCPTNMHFNNKNRFDCLLNLSKDITGRNGIVATSQGEYISVLSGGCTNNTVAKTGCAGCALPGPAASY